MYEVLLVILLLVAIALIGLVMLQQGKGAGMGASFGAGASATLFGSSGSANFLTRTTAILATIFFIICLILGNLGGQQAKNHGNEWDNLGKSEQVAPQQKDSTISNTAEGNNDAIPDNSVTNSINHNTVNNEENKSNSSSDVPQ